MSDAIYKRIEVIGTSTSGIEDAVNQALKRASGSLHGLRWFEVSEIRGDIEDGQVAHWQVAVKVGFRLDDENAGE